MPTNPLSPATTQPIPLGVPPRLAAFVQERRFPSHMFSSFVVLPPKLRFETQNVGETVVLLLRRHPITNIPWIVVALLMLLAPLILGPLFSTIELVQLIISLSPGLPIILTAFWYLVTFGVILSNFFLWYFNVNIATTERIIDIDFFFLLYKEFTEALLNRVEDVTSTTGGFVQAIFDYGNVLVQTAASQERIEFDRVPHPQDAVRIINELVESVSG